MVETITPVVHGGRANRWAHFLGLHVAGAVVSAALFGGLLGGAGAALGAPWGAAGIAFVVVAAGVYLVREALAIEVPVPQLRRQVPDWWRTFFPFAPAAFLYGLGLGVGFLTYLTHGTLVVVATAALASGRPLLGAALLAPFGLARGATAAVARRARTPEASAALVGRLADSASWRGWRAAHALVLVAVLAAAIAAVDSRPSVGQAAAAAAAILSLAFGTAALVKIARPERWRRTLASHGIPVPLQGPVAVGVPLVEIAVAAMPVVGLRSSAGLAAGVVLVAFSAAILIARARSGPRLACGCFGGSTTRDYRLLLARNGLLLAVAALAWRNGSDAWVGGALASPSPADAVPITLVLLGSALIVWAGFRAWIELRHGART